MSVHGLRTGSGAAKGASPNAACRHVEHDQAECGKDQQQGIEFSVNVVLGLAMGNGLGDDSNLLKWQTAEDSFTQQSAFVQDFAHPGGGHPGGFSNLLQQALY